MKKEDLGISLQKYINKRLKSELITIEEIMKYTEMWRMEILFNAFDLYTLCESCGRDHKKNPTKIKWKPRMHK